MNDKPTEQTISNLPVITKFIYSIGVLPTSYKMSMTYEEQVVWLCNYLETTVIPAVNQNGEAVEELQNLYELLRTYVNDYFDNLDVQEEINNKLDKMMEDGSLNIIIRSYVDPYFQQFTNAIDEQNITITQLNNKVTNATNGNPNVANSISDMTDTSKIYVLTTDGKWYYYDTTNEEWTIGGVYQSAVDSDSLDLLEFKVSLYEKGIVPLYNHVNSSTFNDGHYWNNTNGVVQLKTASNYGTFDRFPVLANTTYTIYNMGQEYGNVARTFIQIADVDGNILQTNPSGANNHKFTTTTDGYCYLTVTRTSEYTYGNILVCEDGYAPSTNTLYNVPFDYLILGEKYSDLVDYYEVASQQEVVTYNEIDVGATRYYTSISSAIATINDATRLNRYNIVIDDGTYNETNINLPDYVNLVGASGIRENCIINGELEASASDNDMSGTSTINMNYNNELRNLTVIGKNLRYPVHDETNGVFTNWTQIVDNCVIEHKGNQEVVDYREEHSLPAGNPWSSPHAWGMGASSGANLTIKNSKFISPEYPFYTHGASSFVKPYLITIDSSEMISTELLSSIYIDNTTPTIDGNTIIIKNSLLNSRYQVITNKKVNCIISGKVVPVYQRPTTVLTSLGYPVFTDNTKYMKASENLSKGTFVKSTDGVSVENCDNTTPLDEIIGYVIGDTTSGDTAMIVSGYMQPTQQSWPEEPIVSGVNLYLDSSGKITTSTGTIKVGVTQDRWYKLFM